MGNPPQFLASFFKVFTQTAGNRNTARTQYPTALPDEICCKFSLNEIKAATNNFDRKSLIGEGYFGPVYKGIVDDGKLVAVKRTFLISGQRLQEFQTEGQLLCQIRHQHLVSLMGYCNDKNEKILVYEFMKNGSLADHLYGSGYDPLPWKQRLEICIGVAQGLRYLHTGAKHTVIHSDVNTRNILLDDKWVAKLRNFCLSKMRRQPNMSKVLKIKDLRLAGTKGYMDPEYLRDGELSEKCDVYSFGVVLFEVLCARPVYIQTSDEDKHHLVTWVRRCIGEGTIYDMIDPYLMGRIAPECFKIFVDIAYKCIDENGDTRPEIGEVELMLELALEQQDKADFELDLDPIGKCMYR